MTGNLAEWRTDGPGHVVLMSDRRQLRAPGSARRRATPTVPPRAPFRQTVRLLRGDPGFSASVTWPLRLSSRKLAPI
jgi:hypothetical protein